MFLKKTKLVRSAAKRQYTAACRVFDVEFMNNGRWNKKIETQIGKTNVVLRELHRSVVTKVSFQTPQNCQFIIWSFFVSSPVVMILG